MKGLGLLTAFAGASLAICLVLFGTSTVTPSRGAGGALSAAASGPDLTQLSLGDGKTTTSSPQRGYLFECRALSGGGGASANGPWIHGSTYDLTAKVVVSGSVSWPSQFRKQLKKTKLRLSGNGLPQHATGTYPVQPNDAAYQIDRNPNRISAYSLLENLTARPKYHGTARCVGGQVGVLTTGAALFSAVDGENRDAVAHEVQDSCSGHPERNGVYHYHGLPACLGTGPANRQSKLIGWALDGFPIYGPRGKGGRYLSNADLDECHGTTSKVSYLGEKRKLFHYVANYEFPYTVGCYRGTAVTEGPPG